MRPLGPTPQPKRANQLSTLPPRRNSRPASLHQWHLVLGGLFFSGLRLTIVCELVLQIVEIVLVALFIRDVRVVPLPSTSPGQTVPLVLQPLGSQLNGESQTVGVEVKCERVLQLGANYKVVQIDRTGLWRAKGADEPLRPSMFEQWRGIVASTPFWRVLVYTVAMVAGEDLGRERS